MNNERFKGQHTIESNKKNLDAITLPVVTVAHQIHEAAIANGLELDNPWNNQKQIVIALLSLFAAIPTAEPIRRIWAGIDYHVSDMDEKQKNPDFEMGKKTLNVIVDFEKEKGSISRLEPFFNSELLTSRLGNGGLPHVAELMDYIPDGSVEEKYRVFNERTEGLYFVVYGDPVDTLTLNLSSPLESQRLDLKH